MAHSSVRGSDPTGSSLTTLDDDKRATKRAVAKVLHASWTPPASRSRPHFDPTNCERDLTAAEVEFSEAMQEYKQRSGRMFPTWSEVLEVLRDLDYEKPEGQG
jgi:hypothetical protein